MSLLKISILSFSSFFVLFLLVKLIGNREMSQLSMFDYVVSITIGSIAAEMATSITDNFWEPLISMVVYGILTIIFAIGTSKSVKFRRVVSGKSRILLNNDKIYKSNFKKSKLDINEFLMQCRINGYFNVSDIQTAVLEPNGKISFIPKSLKRPATPEDLNLEPKQDNLLINIILDGYVMEENLQKTGNNLIWLNSELKKQGITNIQSVFLGTCDSENNLSVYVKINKEKTEDYFQ